MMVALVALSAVGCGSGTSGVSGKVTMNGQPVTGGSLTFSPISTGGTDAGKPAAGNVQSDGSYVLGTDSEKDGAAAGRYKVLYSAPAAKYPDGVEPQPGMQPTYSPFQNMIPKTAEVEVKSGSNTIDIELVPPQ